MAKERTRINAGDFQKRLALAARRPPVGSAELTGIDRAEPPSDQALERSNLAPEAGKTSEVSTPVVGASAPNEKPVDEDQRTAPYAKSEFELSTSDSNELSVPTVGAAANQAGGNAGVEDLLQHEPLEGAVESTTLPTSSAFATNDPEAVAYAKAPSGKGSPEHSRPAETAARPAAEILPPRDVGPSRRRSTAFSLLVPAAETKKGSVRSRKVRSVVPRGKNVDLYGVTAEQYKKLVRMFEDDPRLGERRIPNSAIVNHAVLRLVDAIVSGGSSDSHQSRLRERQAPAARKYRIGYGISEEVEEAVKDLVDPMNRRRGRQRKVTFNRFVEVAIEDLLADVFEGATGHDAIRQLRELPAAAAQSRPGEGDDADG